MPIFTLFNWVALLEGSRHVESDERREGKMDTITNNSKKLKRSKRLKKMIEKTRNVREKGTKGRSSVD